jgi:pantetheine-phosphate adenylyltransferase
MKKRKAVYPGTFDPITYGHIDVVRQASGLFDDVTVLVARNTSKSPLFTCEERTAMIRAVFRGSRNVRVDSFEGLLVDYARRHRIAVVVRGLRAVSDFEHEFQMALANRKLDPHVETVFLVPHEQNIYLNSTIVREVARLGGDVSAFVPPVVARRLRTAFRPGDR